MEIFSDAESDMSDQDAPNLTLYLVLRLSVKEMNDTVGPKGFIPSYLVLGTLPQFPTVSLSFQINDHE